MMATRSAISSISARRWLETNTARPRSAARRAQQLADLADAGGIESVRRLVEDQHARIAEHRLGDAEALAHAEGVGADALVETVGEVHQRRDALDLVGWHAEHPREVLEVLAAGHEAVEVGILDDAADAAHRLLELRADVVAAHRDACRASA